MLGGLVYGIQQLIAGEIEKQKNPNP